MESKKSSASNLALTICIIFFIFFTSVNSDINQDRAKCANQLVGLATCLPYVSGDSKGSAPTVDCCAGLKQVLKNSKECLCLLVKDRNDPSLGLKINATLALSLPEKCHAPANVSDCPALLHLPPNSPDAKVFEDFAHSANATSASSAPSEGAANSSAKGQSDKGDGGQRKWMRIEMLFGFLIAYLLFNVQINL